MLAVSLAPLSAQYGKGPGGRAPYEYQPQGRNEAGRFDYYALVLSWSPTYCACQRDRDEPAMQRPRRPPVRLRPARPVAAARARLARELPDARSALRTAPDDRPHARHHAEPAPRHPRVPQARHLLRARTRRLLRSRPPPVRQGENSATLRAARTSRFFVTPGDLREEFLSANPNLKDDSVAVACGGPGGRLREVRICFSREGEFRPCGRNEEPAACAPSRACTCRPCAAAVAAWTANAPPSPAPWTGGFSRLDCGVVAAPGQLYARTSKLASQYPKAAQSSA